MGKLDQLTQHNKTLRYWLSVVVSLTVLCIATIVNDYRADKGIDEITVLAFISAITGIILIGAIQAFINRNSRKIGEL